MRKGRYSAEEGSGVLSSVSNVKTPLPFSALLPSCPMKISSTDCARMNARMYRYCMVYGTADFSRF